MPFQIKYKFKDDEQFFECAVTYEQYRKFRKLPIVVECEVIKEDSENIENYKDEMQEALNLAAKNDTSHIRKLSKVVTS